MVDFGHDILPRQAAAVGMTGTHVEVDLRSDDNFIAVETELPDIAARVFFTRTHLVDVSRIKVIDAQLDSPAEDRFPCFIVKGPREDPVFLAWLAKAHHTETNTGHIHTSIAEFYIFHFLFLLF